MKTVFPKKMHELTLAMVAKDGKHPWEDQLETLRRGEGKINAACILHMVDAVAFGVDVDGEILSKNLQKETREVLTEYLDITVGSDSEARCWHRFVDKDWYHLAKLRNIVRVAMQQQPMDVQSISKQAEKTFAHVPDDIVDRYHRHPLL